MQMLVAVTKSHPLMGILVCRQAIKAIKICLLMVFWLLMAPCKVVFLVACLMLWLATMKPQI
jgi:hypothetical protein